MTEILIREQIDIERRRDRENRIDRINGVEKALAVLQTKFEAALERAVSSNDLKDLKREVDAQMQQTTNAIYSSIKEANDQQVREILGQVELMNARAHEASTKDAKNLRTQIMLMMLATVFSVIGSIVFLGLTDRG